MTARMTSFLCVPNLQGNPFTPTIENGQIRWVTMERSLSEQVERLCTSYNGEDILVGTSFGGLAVWKYAQTQHPNMLRGIVLIDVLPTIQSFPTWRKLGIKMATHLPNRLVQPLYTAYRMSVGERPKSSKIHKDSVATILQRIQSIQNGFPSSKFPVPTLVLSSNLSFHEQWLTLSRSIDVLTAHKKTDPSQQIRDWLESIGT
jgi:pimeloyl-ACP methyl ester carboxylesterase